MIWENKRIFKLDTSHTSYIFRITDHGHAEHVYYGKRLPEADVEALAIKNTISFGGTVDYAPGYCLDSMLLEYSGIGKGDYRHSPLECQLPDGSFTTDFVYQSHEIPDQAYESDCGLPKNSALISSLAPNSSVSKILNASNIFFSAIITP